MGKMWSRPLIFFDQVSGGGPGSVIGEGSGQGSPDIIPYSFENWTVMFEDQPDNDLDGDGNPLEWDDYVKWMENHGFKDFIDENEKP